MRRVLFHRDFQGFTGGHLKVWDYFNHVNASPSHRADIYFSPDSLWDATNPWSANRTLALPCWEPHAADLLFLGGHDWRAVPEAERDRFSRPIINLIQHVRHADPGNSLFAYLPHRAVRICVSQEVRTAIEETRRVNGPIMVIPNGVDLNLAASSPAAERPVEWLICGVKEGQSEVARELGRRIVARFPTDQVSVLTKLLPRPDFLTALAQARRAVLLPRATEGFYLPALEAMALGTLVICPDCIGNRSFCQDGQTALIPTSRAEEALFSAVKRARALSAAQEATILAQAGAMAGQHSLAQERASFHELLAALPALW